MGDAAAPARGSAAGERAGVGLERSQAERLEPSGPPARLLSRGGIETAQDPRMRTWDGWRPSSGGAHGGVRARGAHPIFFPVQEAHHGYLQQGRGVLEKKLPWQQNCHGSTSSSPALLISWKSCLHVIFFGTTQGECLHKMSQSHSRIGFNTLSIQSGIFFRKRTISGSAVFW